MYLSSYVEHADIVAGLDSPRVSLAICVTPPPAVWNPGLLPGRSSGSTLQTRHTLGQWCHWCLGCYSTYCQVETAYQDCVANHSR